MARIASGGAYIQLINVSYFIIIHGSTISEHRIAYKIDSTIGKNIKYAVNRGQCPNYEPIQGVSIGANQLLTEYAGIKYVLGQQGEKCDYHEGSGSVILQPLSFSIHPTHVELPEYKNSIGIWRYDHWSNDTYTQVCLINWNALQTMYGLDQRFCTYMFLFNFILKDLKTIKNTVREVNANIMFFCCREQSSENHPIPILDTVTVDGMVPFYKLPTDATVFQTTGANGIMFMKIIPFVNERMNPMLFFQGGVHITIQGCLYNLLTYYNILTEKDGNILTSMQSEGVTARQFINIMDQHGKLIGEKPHTYMVERLLIKIGVDRLLNVIITIENMVRARPDPDTLTYAIFVKLYPLNYKPRTQEYSEIGHWVSFSFSKEHGCRFVDPQTLSLNSPQGMTVSKTHEQLDSLEKLTHLLKYFFSNYQAIDFIYVNPCGKQHSIATCAIPDSASPIDARVLQGGKAKKNKSKKHNKSKPKYRKSKKHNKSRTNKPNRNKTKCKRM